MDNPVITNLDLGGSLLELWADQDETLVFAAADTVADGTLLARKAVADAIVAAADAGNTGDGTCTAAAVVTGPVVPIVGDYNLECTAAVANGGVFKLEDPNGMLVADGITMTPGAGGATVFTLAGMTFTLTDGATDFVAGDKFALTVASDGKVYPYSATGLGGVQIPKFVLSYDVVATGAGDVPIRAVTAGKVRKERLVIHGGGTVTRALTDQLRDFTIVSQDVQNLSILDNQ